MSERWQSGRYQLPPPLKRKPDSYAWMKIAMGGLKSLIKPATNKLVLALDPKAMPALYAPAIRPQFHNHSTHAHPCSNPCLHGHSIYQYLRHQSHWHHRISHATDPRNTITSYIPVLWSLNLWLLCKCLQYGNWNTAAVDSPVLLSSWPKLLHKYPNLR